MVLRSIINVPRHYTLCQLCCKVTQLYLSWYQCSRTWQIGGKWYQFHLQAIYIYILMSYVQLPGSKTFEPNILIHFITQNNDVSLAKWFQKHLFKEHRKHGVIDQGKDRKISSKKNGKTYSIMFIKMLMLHTKKWKFIFIQTNFRYYHFVVHIQSLAVLGCWLSIINYV